MHLGREGVYRPPQSAEVRKSLGTASPKSIFIDSQGPHLDLVGHRVTLRMPARFGPLERPVGTFPHPAPRTHPPPVIN